MKASELVAVLRGIAPAIQEHVAKATAAFGGRLDALEQRFATFKAEPGPQGRAGDPGAAGPVGPQGEPGAPGATGERGPQGEPGSVGDKGDRGEQGPEGAPGRDGRDGQPGVPGQPGEKGLDGINGKDGRDGIDGLGFDDVEEEPEDDGRVIVKRYRSGDRVKEIRYTTGAMIFRGVWTDARTYLRGDVVTWAGSMWHANETTTVKPGEAALASRAWQLCVKKGNDGRQGAKGEVGERGPQGARGNDGLNYRS